ncbi:type II toxin-antitoxin system VapC family toxin [Limnospira fusiformis KN01]|uniref:Type II toxin-antitoxin system VapC family toxin n=2 Tax=Limnospira fusiformis TaxID=54297 RepID=A0ABU9EUT5_LIMFS|nr:MULTISPECIES: type II toxin-antitoxin system VapC family toxin [Limnospira]MDT9191054.1 type II toxin-antitoxin system VapC family toxin [Limnospira sp. PMC 894.15]MDT9201340.1 type II toxin-antitoxin system VapC family toxin [Limnospira sp. PMC 1042.18]MDT9236988.1 type II toxin-antitoxin system VapC family toxin [Limnospira sp. PMC 917.15]MDT9277845.1 type II toxin-antitoxin system VapC family toxin [Limnospira sp. PMC 737.11]ULB46693.1 type II toxin-antitoxin system VapC family toxin [Li
MIFVDTSAWFASVVPSDPEHQSVSMWMRQNTEAFLTTDYIVDETLTLLRARKETARSLAMGKAFFSGQLGTLYFLSEADIQLTSQIFRQFSDKEWSFTDCSSKVIIEKLQISKALSLDNHFRQFGSIIVIP